ncbi:unnamed protein product [Mytilus coruscus]|uniref:G-protein coupled receptors family 1 profile domain-containing protein n=1 Tax=Mytilus coruscus TaxID=42192 RepID=A0A6J8CSF0_MYTCO|nr:unnamed protein product [Mytilus coruscus]
MMKKNNVFFYSSNLSNLLYINDDNDSEYHPQLCFTYNKSGYLSNPIYGYVIPTIALVLLVLNSLAITVFMTTNRKSPTNILLTALALSDSLGILVISPTFILVYGFGNNFEVMKYPFCIFHDLSYYSASMFHCISKWLTAILAIHRLIVVTMLFSGRRIATMNNSILGIVFIVIFSASINIIPALHSKIYNSVTLYNTEDNEFVGDICVCSGRDTTEKENLVVTWMKDTIGTILPCCILTVVTVLLIFKLKEAKKEMLRLQTETASKKLHHSRIIHNKRCIRKMGRDTDRLRIISMNASGRKGKQYQNYRHSYLNEIIGHDEPDILFLPGDKPDMSSSVLTDYRQAQVAHNHETVLLYDTKRLRLKTPNCWHWELTQTTSQELYQFAFRYLWLAQYLGWTSEVEILIGGDFNLPIKKIQELLYEHNALVQKKVEEIKPFFREMGYMDDTTDNIHRPGRRLRQLKLHKCKSSSGVSQETDYFVASKEMQLCNTEMMTTSTLPGRCKNLTVTRPAVHSYCPAPTKTEMCIPARPPRHNGG